MQLRYKTQERRRFDIFMLGRVPGMHRAGPGERGGASYGRRAVATAKWAAIQISGVGNGG